VLDPPRGGLLSSWAVERSSVIGYVYADVYAASMPAHTSTL
jgi:hypothetical protein